MIRTYYIIIVIALMFGNVKAALTDSVIVNQHMILHGNSGPVNSAVFSPCGNYILAGYEDGSLQLWYLVSGLMITNFRGHIDRIFSVYYNSDGQYAFSASEDGTIKKWNVSNGQNLQTLFSPITTTVSLAAISMSGKSAVTVSSRGSFTLWDLLEGSRDRNFRVRHRGVTSISFDQSDRLILTGNKDGVSHLWNASNGRLLGEFVSIHQGPVKSISSSTDGKHLFTGNYDGTIRMWDIESKNEVKVLTGHQGIVTSLAASPNSKYILSGSDDHNLIIWDIETGSSIDNFHVHNRHVNTVAFSPNGKYLLSGSDDGNIRIFMLEEKIVTDFVQIDIGKEIEADTKIESSDPPKPLRIDGVPISIEQNIPRASRQNQDAIAVIIGNQNYLGDIAVVDFAHRDAQLTRRYVEQALGYRPGNIIKAEDVTLAGFNSIFGDRYDHRGRLSDYVKEGVSDVFVFYSGHGAPDPNTRKGYLVPIDADPNRLSRTGYSLDLLYENLGKISAKSVTVVIDACFSGASRDGGMLIAHASPVGIQIDEPSAQISNSTIITASSDTQIASWHMGKNHGLLTYFFLKGLQGAADFNSDGRITVGEIRRYLTDNMNGLPYYARRLHGRDQMPQVWGNPDRILRQ